MWSQLKAGEHVQTELTRGSSGLGSVSSEHIDSRTCGQRVFISARVKYNVV